MSGWGLSPYGLGAWGLGSGAAADVENVLCTATTVVRVYLSVEPQHTSYFVLGDALNPLSWSITDPTNVSVRVVGVVQVDDTTYELVTLKPLTGSADVFTLGWTLLDPTGAPFLPGSAPFYGMTATLSSAQALVPADLRNPQTSPGLNGTLSVDSSGDYANEHGAELLRKLLIRVLTSTPGDYFFMPNYGAGIRVKEPIPLTDMPSMKALVQTQVRKEPEFSNAKVQLRLDEKRGILFVTVRTASPGGAEVSTTLEIPQNPI